jgi:hypothetical protein
MKKTLKSREFWICVVAYPLIVAAALTLPNILFPIANDHALIYGISSSVAAAAIVVTSLWEIAVRLFKHERQGKHLGIRKRSGIEVPNGKNH